MKYKLDRVIQCESRLIRPQNTQQNFVQLSGAQLKALLYLASKYVEELGPINRDAQLSRAELSVAVFNNKFDINKNMHARTL